MEAPNQDRTDAMSRGSPDRRPIRARSSRVWVGVAEGLVRAGVSANLVSVLAMAAGVVAGGCLYATGMAEGWPVRVLFAASAVLIVLRLVGNMLDGMVAIGSGRASRVGELYNEVPDRVADAAVLVGLGYAAGSMPALGWCAAVLAVFVAYVRAAARVAGAPQDFGGPMAKQHRMAVVIGACLACAVLPASAGEAIARSAAAIPRLALVVIIAGSVVTAALRIRRAARFLGRTAE